MLSLMHGTIPFESATSMTPCVLKKLIAKTVAHAVAHLIHCFVCSISLLSFNVLLRPPLWEYVTDEICLEDQLSIRIGRGSDIFRPKTASKAISSSFKLINVVSFVELAANEMWW